MRFQRIIAELHVTPSGGRGIVLTSLRSTLGDTNAKRVVSEVLGRGIVNFVTALAFNVAAMATVSEIVCTDYFRG